MSVSDFQLVVVWPYLGISVIVTAWEVLLESSEWGSGMLPPPPVPRRTPTENDPAPMSTVLRGRNSVNYLEK